MIATSYAYDLNGNLTTKTDANGVISCFGDLSGSTCNSATGYDVLNRPLKKTYSDATPTLTYTYGASTTGVPYGVNRLLSVANAVSTTSYTAYDPLGRVAASTQTTNGQPYTFSNYTWNRAGALTSIAYPSGRVVNTTYDGAGRPGTVSGMMGTTNTTYAYVPSGPTPPFGYAPQGAVQQMNLGNNLIDQTVFSPKRLQPTSINLGPTAGSNSVMGLNFTYCDNGQCATAPNNNGNIRSQQVTGQSVTQTYLYDKANRLTSASETGGTSEWSQTYGYNAYGNRWVSASPGFTLSPFTPTTSSFFDAYNRLNLAVGSAYDNVGNQTQQGGYVQTYDAEGHVKSSTINSATTTYGYDGDGRRVTKVTGGLTTVYVYDAQGDLAAEYSGSPVAPACTTCYLTKDHLGSTRVVTNSVGTVVSCHDYLPFGEEIPAPLGGRSGCYGAGDNLTQRFTGKERDSETILDYFGARSMSGAQGRFTSVDPEFRTPSLFFPQSWNGYAYTLNNPFKYVDPDGHVPINIITAGVGAVVGGVVGAAREYLNQVNAAGSVTSGGRILTAAGGGALAGSIAGFTLGIGAGAGVAAGVVETGVVTASSAVIGDFAQHRANDSLGLANPREDATELQDTLVNAATAGAAGAAGGALAEWLVPIPNVRKEIQLLYFASRRSTRAARIQAASVRAQATALGSASISNAGGAGIQQTLRYFWNLITGSQQQEPRACVEVYDSATRTGSKSCE